MSLAGNMFVIAIQLGAPIIIVLLLTSVAMGIMARTVPQMHIFIVAMPLKIAIGFIFMGLALPHMSVFMGRLFATTSEGILLLLYLCRRRGIICPKNETRTKLNPQPRKKGRMPAKKARWQSAGKFHP